ncbi:MAG: RNA-protein complex protein Nop10 [Candidatus Woesearchaeota archaeon]
MHILKCKKCGQYALNDKCSTCNITTERIIPVKYSPEDKYAEYRREAKKEEK